MTTPLRALLLAVLASASALAQPTRGATITGIVVDSAQQPIEGADIIARPGNHRVRSDSGGRFTLTGLDAGAYVVAARKVGFAPDRWDLTLSRDGRLDVRFVLGRRTQLDTVVVVARSACPPYTIAGFMCRRRAGGGVFLDYPEIDETGARETAELFRGVPGFRVEIQPTRTGPVRVARLSTGSGCIRSLVDGRPATAANLVPQFAADLTAIEIYLKPDSVPEVYRRHVWPSGGAERSGRCALVVYWTIWAPYEG